MNIKILKYQLFTLCLLTLITLSVFYYRDQLPDHYLTISSDSSFGFFSYYGISALSFVNYYSGPWVFIPFALFTLFYIFIFSKRADIIDLFNVFLLYFFCGWMVYYLAPSLMGAGLFQLLTKTFSPEVSGLLMLVSFFVFIWGLFRGGFTDQVKSLADKTKNAKWNFNFKRNYKNEFKPNELKHLQNMKEEKKENNLPEIIELPASDVVVIDSEMEIVNELVSDDDSEYVNESEIGLSLRNRDKENFKFDEEKYFNLVGMASHKKSDQKFTPLDDRYFHDIINKIQAKLNEFKVQGRIINVLKGPVVDTFEWELGVGEKVSRLTVTAEDLSLALSGSPIRMVYPMKGRTTVGIEVPRSPRDFIFLDEIISSKDYTHSVHQLPLAMGKDAFGVPVVVDLASMPHMLVAGSTGAGKSVFINSILVSLLIKKSPNQMKLILIDPKQLELALYSRLPHLIMPVVTEAKKAATSLLWATEEMERRYSIMTEFGVRNIEGFNHKLKRADPSLVEKITKYYEHSTEGSLELPYIVIIVDEFADLILTQKGKDIETHICRLAAKARAAGIHLILATQRPSVDVITGLIKSNFPTRVSFRVTSSTDSRTILNAMGAEKLLGKGDMLYKAGVDTTRIHSAYVEEDEIESLTNKLAEMAPSFDPHIIDYLENGGEEESELNLYRGEGDYLGEKDDKYEEALKVVMEHRSASASLLQRRLGVGYNRAANLIEEMEVKGVVGPAQGSKPRKVLIGPLNQPLI